MTGPALAPLYLLLTGSRQGIPEHKVHERLSMKLEQTRGRGLILVHGDCPEGVDHFGHRWYERERVHSRIPLKEERCPADWQKYGNGAGFRRNETMVRKHKYWGVLGFVGPCMIPNCKRSSEPHGSHGTTHCLKVAKHYKLPIRAWKVGW